MKYLHNHDQILYHIETRIGKHRKFDQTKLMFFMNRISLLFFFLSFFMHAIDHNLYLMEG